MARDSAEGYWSERAAEFVERRIRSDSFEWEIARVEEHLVPGGSLLEIGPGGGAMTRRLAGRAGRITAVEPSPAQRAELERGLAEDGIRNVRVVAERWEDAAVEPHDVVLAANCLYAFYDVERELVRMRRATRGALLLTIWDGEMAGDMAYAEAALALGLGDRFGRSPLLPDLVEAMNSLDMTPKVWIHAARRGGMWGQRFPDLDDIARLMSRRLQLSPERGPELRAYLERAMIHDADGWHYPDVVSYLAFVSWTRPD